MTAISTQALAENLKQKIQDDEQFDELSKKQLACHINNILLCISPFPDIQEERRESLHIDDPYAKYISALWMNISGNDNIKPSMKRSALYAVEELQKPLWHK